MWIVKKKTGQGEDGWVAKEKREGRGVMGLCINARMKKKKRDIFF